MDTHSPSRTSGSSNTNYCSSQHLRNCCDRETFGKTRSSFSVNVTLLLPPCHFTIRSRSGSFFGIFLTLNVMESWERQPIPKYCLTLTHVENSPKSLPSRKLVLKYKYVGFLHIIDICAEACSWLGLRKTLWFDQTPISTPQPDPVLSPLLPRRVPPCPVWNGFYQQSMLLLIGKLDSHMLPICFVFLDLQDTPHQISFRLNAFGGCTLPASAEISEQPPRA